MKILAVVSGEFGRRKSHIAREHGPQHWQVHEWTAPSHFPIVIDDPLDFIPAKLPAADLILALGEHPGIAELYPDIAKMTGAKAMSAPIDNSAWMPKGLMNQLRGWMKEVGVFCAFPKPFCSLTDTSYSLRSQRVEYSDPFFLNTPSILDDRVSGLALMARQMGYHCCLPKVEIYPPAA